MTLDSMRRKMQGLGYLIIALAFLPAEFVNKLFLRGELRKGVIDKPLTFTSIYPLLRFIHPLPCMPPGQLQDTRLTGLFLQMPAYLIVQGSMKISQWIMYMNKMRPSRPDTDKSVLCDLFRRESRFC